MDLAQQVLARSHLIVDAVDHEADVPLVMLALGPLGEGADVLDRQRMQMQQLTEPIELIGRGIVQIEPEVPMRLQEPRDLIKVSRLEQGARRIAGAHAAQTKPGSGGPRWREPS